MFLMLSNRKENQVKQAKKEAEAKEKAERRVYVLINISAPPGTLAD